MTKDTQLFRGGEQFDNFTRMAMIHPCRRVARAPKPAPFPLAPKPLVLPKVFASASGEIATQAFLDETRSTGLYVVHEGQVVYQNYWLGMSQTSQHISFSVAKSFISTLIAFALRDGLIDSIDTPVDHYAPELKGSGYERVALRHVLQMSSGVRWNEDYGDPNSDVARFAAAFEKCRSFDDVAASLPREHVPGTYNRYNSCDTHVLGMVLARVTGQSVSEYLEKALWHRLGMEDDAFFLVDGQGVEASGMGLNVTLRDFAKLGQLMLNRGVAGGKQWLPEGWWDGCAKPAAPHLAPGPRDTADYPFGYGYQWWLPDTSGAFTAMGVYYQYIWVDPNTETVIVKTSADPRFGQDADEMDAVDIKHFGLFHAIGAAARQSAQSNREILA